MKKKIEQIEQKMDIKEYLKILSVNQGNLYQMLMALNQSVACLEMKIKSLEKVKEKERSYIS
jgi:hypothetical protein